MTNSQTVSMATVTIRFLPDDVTIQAKVGEAWLDVAARAGVHISTGCLAGACHACTIEISTHEISTHEISFPEISAEGFSEEEPVLACLQTVPQGFEKIEVNLLDDPTW